MSLPVPASVASGAGAITVRYVAKDWRKPFRFGPETTVVEAVAACLAAFNPGDREPTFPPHQQYGLYLYRKVRMRAHTLAHGRD
jgi:hypothetical protein